MSGKTSLTENQNTEIAGKKVVQVVKRRRGEKYLKKSTMT